MIKFVSSNNLERNEHIVPSSYRLKNLKNKGEKMTQTLDKMDEFERLLEESFTKAFSVADIAEKIHLMQ